MIIIIKSSDHYYDEDNTHSSYCSRHFLRRTGLFLSSRAPVMLKNPHCIKLVDVFQTYSWYLFRPIGVKLISWFLPSAYFTGGSKVLDQWEGRCTLGSFQRLLTRQGCSYSPYLKILQTITKCCRCLSDNSKNKPSLSDPTPIIVYHCH